jgi:hypothetical protein
VADAGLEEDEVTGGELVAVDRAALDLADADAIAATVRRRPSPSGTDERHRLSRAAFDESRQLRWISPCRSPARITCFGGPRSAVI